MEEKSNVIEGERVGKPKNLIERIGKTNFILLVVVDLAIFIAIVWYFLTR